MAEKETVVWSVGARLCKYDQLTEAIGRAPDLGLPTTIDVGPKAETPRPLEVCRCPGIYKNARKVAFGDERDHHNVCSIRMQMAEEMNECYWYCRGDMGWYW